MSFCPECGNQTPPGAHFCAACGKSLPAISAATVQETPTAAAPVVPQLSIAGPGAAAPPIPPPVVPVRMEIPQAAPVASAVTAAPTAVHVKKSRPGGIIFLSAMAFISAGFCLAVAMIFAGLQGEAVLASGWMPLVMIVKYVPTFGPEIGEARDALIQSLGIRAIEMFVLAILYVAIGWGLFKLRPWGRILTLVLVILATLSAMVNLGQAASASHLGDIFWYLIVGTVEILLIRYLFKPKVRQAFAP